MKILIAAGGSGGHLLPAQQLASELQGPAEILFAAHKLGSSPFFAKAQFPFQSIASAPLKKSPKGLFVFLRETAKGFWQSVRLLRAFQPDLVVGFGSFHVFPLLLASLLLRKKMALFEANCLMGKVNRLFAPFSQLVASQFPLKGSSAVPLLPWVEQKKAVEKKIACEHYGLDPSRPVVLVFGGSQGAVFLNRTVPLSLPPDLQVIHLAGSDEAAREASALYGRRTICAVVKSFETNMQMAYAAADLAICRSGAGTIAELVQQGLPALLVPFPFASDDHQRINAEFLVKVGGALMMKEALASPEALRRMVQELFEQKESCREALERYRKECGKRRSFKEQLLELV